MVNAARTAGDLLARIDPDADMVHRHLWLMEVLDWVRAGDADVPTALARVEALLEAADNDPAWPARWAHWWRRWIETLDPATLMAEFGFASRPGFLAEWGHRLRRKCLPASPQTTDLAELFPLWFSDPRDAHWMRALPTRTLQRLGQWFPTVDVPGADPAWTGVLLDALSLELAQIGALGCSAEVRTRMAPQARQSRVFHELPAAMQALRTACSQTPAAGHPDALQAAAMALGEQLDHAQQAAHTAYAHLDEHGISVGVVFRLRQLRERILRAKALMECLRSQDRPRATAHLIAHLITVGHDSRSIRALVASSTQMTAARIAERSAETGEHYITRDWPEYRQMLWRAGGGGALLGFTTWFKFLIGGWALSAFWGGLAAGVNYAMAFVVIQLLHLTVATKQPAVTAPAMVAKLKDLRTPESVLRFVDEVAHLFRSQMAAIAGNVGAVIPVVLIVSMVLMALRGSPMIDATYAHHVIDAHQLWGPTLLFAALTGVLLFASSIVAGWAENAFVLHRLDTAMAYNPAITRRLGADRAARWAAFLRAHISGLAANISLGLMLGLAPALAAFFGLNLEVRHVTLVMGQLAAAVASLGPHVLLKPAFWSALGAAVLVGVVNVSVSFYLAFRLALKAQGVSDVNRSRIYRAIRHRWRKAPWSFVWPAQLLMERQAVEVVGPAPADEEDVPPSR